MSECARQTYPSEDVRPVCPLQENASKTVGLGKDLVRSLRRLRRDLQACKTCPSGKAGRICPVRQDFNNQVDTAIAELNAEWGWDA